MKNISLNARLSIALAIVVLASIGGAWMAAQQGGEAGANAAREEAEKTAFEQDLRTRAAQVEGCERANVLRMESNQRIKSHRADASVLRQFLSAAHDAREIAWEREGAEADLVAAQKYADLIVFLDEHVKFSKIARVDCEAAFPPPEKP